MKAGLLKEKITILTSKIINSDYGENKVEWVNKYTTRANVKYNSENRLNENNEIYFSTDITFKVRYYVDIDGFNRILYNGKQYRILSILPDKEKQEITIVTQLVNE